MVTQSFGGALSITDMAGKIIYKQKLNVRAGNNVIELGSFNHASGIYYLVFAGENGSREVVKFIKK